MAKLSAKSVNWSLYAILDKEVAKGRSLERLTEQLIAGGAGVIQYRDKVSDSLTFFQQARKIKRITEQLGVPLVINDRLDVAMAVGAEGVHLGQQDLPIPAAKKLAGDRMLIGASVRNRVEGLSAIEFGADYLGLGAIFPTDTKKEKVAGLAVIRELRPLTDKPLIAIGGIKLQNLRPIFEAGADGVAVISGLLGAEDVRVRALEFITEIKELKSRSANQSPGERFSK